MQTIFTIGHSTRTTSELLALLQQVAVDHLVDVRAVPRSCTSSQFNCEDLQRAIGIVGIEYRHIAALGGLRHQRASNAGWTDGFSCKKAFEDYADFAKTTTFQTGLTELREIALDHCCAIMCSEAVWWECHRRIIADYLIAGGITVAHIVGPGKIDLATLTPGARLLPGGQLRYPQAW
jgi:uncharacterized protein (DUF488 family)